MAPRNDKSRAQRAERNRTREMRGLADKILTVHKRYPTGDVVVSEPDLAEQLRKRRDAVAKALNILLGERKVQKAPLNGYWKLRSRPTPLRMYSWPASRRRTGRVEYPCTFGTAPTTKARLVYPHQLAQHGRIV